MVVWGKTALHQAVCRDNSLEMIETLLDSEFSGNGNLRGVRNLLDLG